MDFVSLKSSWLFFPSLQFPVAQRVHGMPQFVMRSAWQTSNMNMRVSFSFPIHVLVNSLSTVDIMSLDTVTFTQWKLSRSLNNIGSSLFSFAKLQTFNQKINEEIMLFHVCFKDTTWTKHTHFAQMQWRIIWTFIFWVQNRLVNLRQRSLKTKKRNICPLKTKQPAPKPIHCYHDCSLRTKDACIMKKGSVRKSCQEQTTLIIVINYHHQFFSTRKLRHGLRTEYVCTMRRGLYRILLGTDNT